MSRQSSPARDKRVMNLAAEVAETRDRRVPILLLKLKEILSTAPAGSKDGMRIRREIWEYNIFKVLVLVLKQDFSIVDGDWQTAASLAAILSQVCSSMELGKDDRKKFQEECMPDAVNNMFLVARHIHGTYSKLPDKSAGIHFHKQKERQRLVTCFRGVLEALIYMSSGHSYICKYVIESPWLLQLLISDDIETAIGIMDLLPKILRLNRTLLKEVEEKLVHSIMDELIYKLSVNNEVTIGAAATKCVLKICDIHKPVIDILCTRYRGLRHLLSKWEGRGFGKDLKDFLMLLQAGNSTRAQMEISARAAILIQCMWRGFIARKKLERADKAFSNFHIKFRHKKTLMERRKEQAKEVLELQRQLKLSRQKIMREFNEKKYQSIEILPASKVEKYIQTEQTNAAKRIQRMWRGHNVRSSMNQKLSFAREVKAAIKIQRGVRIWLERLENRRKKYRAEVLPPGLTEARRVELQKKIIAYREENPTRCSQPEDLEPIHEKASEMLRRYYMTARSKREKLQHREALVARLDTDSELIMLAPSLPEATEKDVDMYSSRSLAMATKAKANHTEQLRLLRMPWYKKLIDQYQDQEFDDDEALLF